MARTAKPANQKVAALITRPPDRHPSVLFSFGFFLFFNFSNERHARWWSISAATAATTTTTTTDAGLSSLGNAIRRDPAPCVGPPSAHTHPRRIRSVGQGLLRWKSRKEKKQQQSAKHEQREEALWRLTALHCVIEVRKRIEKKANLVASEADHQNDDKTGYNTVTHTEPNPKMKQKNKTKKQTKRSPLDWTEGDR